MAEIFTYVASIGFSRKSKAVVNSAMFGDGYSQRIVGGINSLSETWDLTFTHSPIADANSIISFFEARKGAEHFLWTPPDSGTQYKVTCEEWSTSYASPISRTITCTFKRVYDVD